MTLHVVQADEKAPDLVHGPAAADLAGITYRQLHYWTAVGYLKPVGEKQPGSGHQRMYDRAEVDVARLMGRLIKCLQPVSECERVARALHAHPRAEVPVDGGFVLTMPAKAGEE